jgi:Mg2+ and Co2+ transporter CorA
LSSDIIGGAQQDPSQLLVPIIRLVSSLLLAYLRNFEKEAPKTFKFGTTSDPEEPLKQMDVFNKTLKTLRDSNESVKSLFSGSPTPESVAIVREFQFVLDRHESVGQSLREQLNYTASIASLKESRLGIQQNQSVKRLTQLAFVFIPLNFVTSVFGMNITPLSGDGAKWWTVLVGAVICYALLAMPLFLLNRQFKEWRVKRRKPKVEWAASNLSL